AHIEIEQDDQNGDNRAVQRFIGDLHSLPLLWPSRSMASLAEFAIRDTRAAARCTWATRAVGDLLATAAVARGSVGRIELGAAASMVAMPFAFRFFGFVPDDALLYPLFLCSGKFAPLRIELLLQFLLACRT